MVARRTCEPIAPNPEVMFVHHHSRIPVCGGLFGCGEDDGRRYMTEPDAVDAALDRRTRDRLLHRDEMDRESLEPYLASYRVSRRRLFGVGGIVSALAAITPASLLAALRPQPAEAATGGGRTHEVQSTSQTVRLGVFDATLPNLLEIESGRSSIAIPGRTS